MSEQLRSAIQQVAGWQKMTPAELSAALTAISRTKKPESERVWSIAGIARVFSMELAEGIYQALVAAGSPGIAARFAATGLDATDPQWQATADALITGPLKKLKPETQQALKYIGFRSHQIWTDPLTAADVATAKQQLINIAEVESLRAEIENTWINPALADGTMTVAEVKSAIRAGLE